MKSILFILLLILIFCCASHAQTNETLPCPKISIAVPAELTKPGETMSFTANVEDNNWKNLTYKWTITKGTIIEGLGTSVVKVQTNPQMNFYDIIATVEIVGLPLNCPNKISEKAFISNGISDSIPFTQYGKIPFAEEKAHLDVIALELKQCPGDIALFIIYFTKKESYTSIKNRIAKISKLLVGVHKIPKDKFKFVYSEEEIQSNVIYFMSQDEIDSFPGVEKDLKKLKPQNQKSKNSVGKIKRQN